jgi:hypothetical protein
MRKLLAALVLLTVVALAVPSYGAINSGHHVLIYKGTLKAAKTAFNTSDLDNLASVALQGYWAVDINDANDANTATFGHIDDVNAVLFDTKTKKYKVISGGAAGDPCDPRGVVEMTYFTADAQGNLSLDVFGKGKEVKIFDANKADANTLVKEFVPASLKGTGGVSDFNSFPDGTHFTGVGTVSLTLDATLTKKYNSAGFTVDQAINDILITKLKKLTAIPFTFEEIL